MMELQKRQELFSNPPREFRGKPFWSWNGKLEKDELLRQIDVMKQMGFGGYFMHSRTGLATEYLGKEWFDLINDCTDYGTENGMESWLYDEDRWPSGTAGGIVTKEEKYRSMFLEMDRYPYEAYGSIDWKKPAVIAFGCFLDGVNYSKERILKEEDGLLPGETAVLFRVRYSECKDFYNGYTYLNTMNKEAVDRFIQVTHEAYREKCGDRIGTSLKGIFTDEPHRGALFSVFSEGRENAVPYTPGLFYEFEKKFGYDLKVNLLELFLVKDDRKISKVTRDYIELCQELFIRNYAVPIQKWCRKNNMIFTGHVLHEDSLTAQTVMQGSLMRFYEYMDYPGVDVLYEGNRCYWIVKQVASVARQLDKKWILSELYGCTGWQMDFESYKNVGDWQALLGVNLRCPHLSWYTMNGEAKRDYPASILHQSAWHDEYKYVEDYYSRIHTALFDGKPDCELLVLNPIESVWARAYSSAFDVLEARDEGIQKLEKQYTDVFDSLIRSRIDFDYGEEDILSRHGHIENGLFIVGQCSYRKVLIAGMDTMRSSTLALLKEFMKQGGEVIFAGDVPGYLDAEPSNEIVKLSKKAVRIQFTREAIAASCRSGNEITIDGDADRDIFAQVRTIGEDKAVMLLNINRDISYKDVKICLGEGNAAELWDAKSGRIYRPKQQKRNGRIYLKTDFAKGEEKLYMITKEKRNIPLCESEKRKVQVRLPEGFHYRLSEKNICVLDTVSITTDQGEAISCREVLKADCALRDLLGIPYRGGAMVQPWYQLKYGQTSGRKFLCSISLEYKFDIETVPKDVILVTEDLEHITGITVNGKRAAAKSIGKWIDVCYDKISLPDRLLTEGTNRILIQLDYGSTSGIESIFLLGDFGVKLADGGRKPVITILPDILKPGDITDQGFPFYSGKITYIINDLSSSKLRVNLEGFEGACARLIGDQATVIGWAPYTADVNHLTEIELILTRRNTFGPLHQLPAKTASYGPESFVTSGGSWSDAYVLLPQGLMKKPKVWEIS